MFSRHLVVRMLTVAVTMLMPTALSAPAQSLDLAPSMTPTVQTRTEVSDACLAAIEAYNDTVSAIESLSSDLCTSTVTLEVSAASNAGTSSLALTDTTAPSDLRAASLAGTVTSKYFKQTVVHGTDQETQSGVFYYNGSKAWIQTYAGSTGSHRCWVNYAVGYTIDVVACDGGAAGNPARARMGLKVTTPGLPITWNEEHFVSLHANGTFDW